MRVLSLFSGGGLGDYGLTLAGMEIAGQVEIDEYCQKILALRWPDVPKWKDIHDVTGEAVRERCGAIQLIAGGFPCQPHSFAGQQRGAEDDRNLWPQMSRIISEIRPPWILAENVPGSLGFAEQFVLPDLESQGYETVTFVFPAHALGAPHRRDRVWVVAHAGHGSGWNFGTSKRREAGKGKRPANNGQTCGSGGQPEYVANTKHETSEPQTRIHEKRAPRDNAPGCGQALEKPAGEGLAERTGSGQMAERRKTARTERSGSGQDVKRSSFEQWATEPGVGRVAHGVPHRVDRLKLLGNGQVVQCVQWLGEKIMASSKQMPADGGDAIRGAISRH